MRYYLCGESFANRWRPFIRKESGLLGPLNAHTETRSPESADLIVASEHIQSLKVFHQVSRPRHHSLQLCLEAVFPDYNFFDWTISFVPDKIGGRNFRPHPHLTFAEGAGTGNAPFRYPSIQETPGFSERQFCDFIYSNPNAHPFRDSFFHLLNDRKEVTSLGRHLNGGTLRFTTGQEYKENWIASNISAKAGFRFSLAIENSSFEGYTSEKIMTSIAAGGVPIYWGNRLAEEDFNKKRFISLHEYESPEAAVELLVEMADYEDWWNDFRSQPVFTGAQLEQLETNRIELANFWADLTESVACGVVRRGVGYWPEIYSSEVGGLIPQPKWWSYRRLRKRLVVFLRKNSAGDKLLTGLSELVIMLRAKWRSHVKKNRRQHP